MSTANSRVEAVRQELRQSYAELTGLLDGPISALYAGKLYQAPAENEWTVMEGLAHIVEFLPYWGDAVAALVARPGQPFGRTQDDPERLAALSEHGHDNLAQVRAALPGSYAHLDEVLSRFTDADLDLTGIHPRRGEQTAAYFIDEFIIKHLHDHIAQLRECLAS